MTTAVTGKDLAGLKGPVPRPTGSHHRPKAHGGNSRSFIVCGVAIMIMLGGAAIVLKLQADRGAAPSPQAVSASHNVGLITLAPEGAWCRQLSLDNQSGRMVEVGRIKCVGPGSVDPEQQMRERYSGGRIESIRKSFSGGR